MKKIFLILLWFVFLSESQISHAQQNKEAALHNFLKTAKEDTTKQNLEGLQFTLFNLASLKTFVP